MADVMHHSKTSGHSHKSVTPTQFIDRNRAGMVYLLIINSRPVPESVHKHAHYALLLDFCGGSKHKADKMASFCGTLAHVVVDDSLNRETRLELKNFGVDGLIASNISSYEYLGQLEAPGKEITPALWEREIIPNLKAGYLSLLKSEEEVQEAALPVIDEDGEHFIDYEAPDEVEEARLGGERGKGRIQEHGPYWDDYVNSQTYCKAFVRMYEELTWPSRINLPVPIIWEYELLMNQILRTPSQTTTESQPAVTTTDTEQTQAGSGQAAGQQAHPAKRRGKFISSVKNCTIC